MFALTEALRTGQLAPRHWLANVIAGTTVGVIALPLALAFAIASGVKPEQGLYTAIIAGLVVSVFGGSRVQIAGPTGAFIVILSGIVAQHGIDGLLLATLMAGVILCAFSLARLGAVIRYIPIPVIMGFTAGIGVIIFVGQWQAFFGLPAAEGRYFHEQFGFLLRNLSRFDGLTTLFGLASLVLVLLPRFFRPMQRIPGPLLALLVATLIQGIFHFHQVATIGSAFGGIPRGLPTPALPEWSADELIGLIAPAFAIAMLGAIESLLSAVVADGMAGTRHDSNAELMGQGLANILSPLFGGIAATGAIARTAANIRSGGTSPLAGIVHAIVLVLVLVLLAPLASFIPLATLAAVLFVVAWDMSSAPGFIRLARRAPRADVVILLVTFLLTVFADLVVAVNIGIVLAVLHFLRRMADSVEVIAPDETDFQAELSASELDNLPDGVEVHEVRGPLFFAGIERFKNINTSAHVQVLILRLDLVPFADATALLALEELAGDLQAQGVQLILCGANERVAGKISRMHLRKVLGEAGVQPDLSSALKSLHRCDFAASRATH